MNELLDAIRRADIAAVRECLSMNPKLITENNGEGVPVGLRAAETGDLALVRYIVEYTRLSLDAVDGAGRDMLHYAAASGCAEACAYLVERCGMSPLRGDAALETPYETSRRLGHTRLERYFESVVGAPLERMYKNPIRRGMFPDPSVVRVGNDYYMVNSSFTYFPCIPVSHSRDLVNWHVIGHAIENPEWSGLSELQSGCGYWAPDISYSDGRFYICATYRMNDGGATLRRQMVVSSERPEGPYSRPAFIDEDGIDPSIFHDDDGRHYMLLNRGARIFELSADCKRQASEARLLYYGDGKRAPEGPQMLKKDGWYYLFLAEGGTGTGHCETVARSRELTGVYEPCPHNPIIRQTDARATLQRCGHGKPISTPEGEWYMTYLCGRVYGGCTLVGRETALDPITWTADGWPVVNGGCAPSALQVMPARAAACAEACREADWLTPREPREGEIARSGGEICINGGDYTLDDIRCRSLLLRRQTEPRFDFEAALAAPPERGEAGIVCYYDERSFIAFCVKREADGLWLCAYERIGSRTVGHKPLALEWADGKPLRLTARADGLRRELMYAAGGGEPRRYCVIENAAYLCDEGLSEGKRFTGAMVGVYAIRGARARFVAASAAEIRGGR